MTNSGPQLTNAPALEVALVRFPGSQATTVHGLTDLFHYADHFARQHDPTGQPRIRVRHWELDGAEGAPAWSFDSHPGLGERTPSVVIVPASQLAPMDAGCAPRSVNWVRERHAEGAIVAAVCGGVFLLAESGLLEGRRATTHWMFAAELRRRFPGIHVDEDLLVIDDGDLITAGGVLAWTDLGLSLVERLLGPSVMGATARFMIMDPPRREQCRYRDFVPPLQHGDRAILAVQHWIQSQVPVDASVAALAARAGLGERTFLRRFLKATGMRPSQYQLRLRLARSRELLELTQRPIDQIAADAGYEDAGGFRRIFKRVMGVAPGEYRRRFQRSIAAG